MRYVILLLVLPLAACLPAPPTAMMAKPAPVFSPQSFFAGTTEGDGTLKIMLSPRRHIVVHGRGRVETDGTLVLDQDIIEGSKAPSHRQWCIRETAPQHYAGTLSNANGPVRGDARGNELDLSFDMNGGLHAEQVMRLSADGQSAANRMTIRKLGVVVAVLDERIRKTS